MKTIYAVFVLTFFLSVIQKVTAGLSLCRTSRLWLVYLGLLSVVVASDCILGEWRTGGTISRLLY